MTAQIKLALKATKVFFFVRFVACACVGVFYLLVAANVQYLFVKLLGESTFNYIIGGILSLVAGVAVCGTVGNILFLFIRGWHISAIAYSKTIVKKNYGALDAGMTIFRKHFTSFVAVWGIGVMIRKAAKSAITSFWDLLQEIPFLNSLKKFAQNPFVSRIAEDVLNTAFDALVYYEIKYTKPGLADDAEVVGIALKKYLLSLPQTIIGSFLSLVMLYLLPRIIAVLSVLYIIVNEGVVAGILISVLLYPLFYLLNHTIFEPLETVMLIAGFAKQCAKIDEEDSESPYMSVVNSILEDMGLGELLDDSEEEDAEEEAAEEEVKSAPTKKPKRSKDVTPTSVIEVEEELATTEFSVGEEEPEVVMMEEPDVREIVGCSGPRSINELAVPLSSGASGVINADIFKDERVKPPETISGADIRAFTQRASARDRSQNTLNQLSQMFGSNMQSAPEPTDAPEEESAPANIFDILQGVDESALAADLERLDGGDVDLTAQQNHDNTLGGGSIDIL